MTTQTRSVVFRVTGLPNGKAEETVTYLTAVIKEHLSAPEIESIKYDISAIPSCDNENTSAALADFKNGIPLFLNYLAENPLDDWPVETKDGDVNFDRHFFGFTQLYYPDLARPVIADIIAITGLDGHAYGSWRGKANLGRMWLRDFLSKDLPHCRTLTYGYNSKLLSRGIDTIMTYGLEFMEGLKRVRDTPELRQRPIIFIAHSFGGIVLAHCLVKAKQADEDDHPTIAALYRATYGILFFGTPHKGLMIEDIKSMLEGEDSNPRSVLLQQINQKSDVLIAQLVDFKNLIRDRKIVSFFETEQTRRLQWDTTKKRWRRTGSFIIAVDTDSAILQLPTQMETSIPLHSDHSRIVKFDSTNALGYKFALEKLKVFAADAPTVVADRFNGQLRTVLPLRQAKNDNQPTFMVPFNRDLRFVGRKDVIQKIDDTFKTQRRVALYGIGGIGKSQIAIEYCYIWKGRHNRGHVFWVHASTRDRFEEAYKGIARELSLPGHDDPSVDTIKIVRDWLCKQEDRPWLLVIDNADDIEMFFGPSPCGSSLGDLKSANIADLLPQSPSGSILTTTRDKRVAQRLTDRQEVIMISTLAQLEAEQLLRVKVGQEVDFNLTDSQRLLEILGYIPLAITQAAAFITENFMTVTTYIDELSNSESNLQDYLDENLPDPRRDPTSENSVIRTWKVSFDQIAREKLRAADLLSLMVCLDRQAIPKTLLQEDGERSIEFNKALATLQAFSLITTEKGGSMFEVHRLVHLSTQKWLRLQGTRQKWQEKALELMAREFPSGRYESWPVCEMLQPHANAVIRHEYVSERILLRRTYLLENLARYSENQGQYGVAYPLYKEVYKMRELILGSEHPDTLIGKNNLAEVLRSLGKYEEAEQMHWQTLELRKKVSGPEHPSTLPTMNNLAAVLQSLGRYEEAEQMHWQTLELKKKVSGPEHPSTLLSMNNLALVLQSLGRYEEAEQMHWQTFELRKKVSGPEHPSTLLSMNNLASVLQSLGRYEEAEQMHKKVLHSREEVLGPEHPDTLSSAYGLAFLLCRRREYGKGIVLYERACAGYKKLLGPHHPDTVACEENYSSMLEEMKEELN